MMEWRYKNVHFLGFVDNLTTALRDTIMIVPIIFGSGIRMKILEACMIGVPVVTTSIGMEGLPLINGDNCFVADTPSLFVDAILSLSDSNIRNSFISKARETINKYYSLEALKKNRISLYQ